MLYGGIRNYWPKVWCRTNIPKVEKFSTCFFDVKCTQIKIFIARLLLEISKYFRLLFFMGQSPDVTCEVWCANQRKGALIDFLRSSEKKIPGGSGRGLYEEVQLYCPHAWIWGFWSTSVWHLMWRIEYITFHQAWQLCQIKIVKSIRWDGQNRRQSAK